MSTQLQSLQDYLPPGLRSPQMAPLIYDEFGREVIDRVNREFPGVKAISYEGITLEEGKPIAYVNTPRLFAINKILLGMGARFHVPDAREIVAVDASAFDDTFVRVASVLLGREKGQDEELRIRLMQDLGKTSLDESLVVSGLRSERVDNSYGFVLRKTDTTQVLPVSAMRDVATKAGVLFYHDDRGLRRVYRVVGVLYANWGRVDLVVAYEAGRVQVVRAA